MGTCVCICLIHFVVQQKLTQYCEAVILQERSIKKKKNMDRFFEEFTLNWEKQRVKR